MILRSLLSRVSPGFFNRYANFSFSQCGEDMIIDFIFKTIEVTDPSYIDIGANHPFMINNTARLYKQGSIGINIEPSPHYFHLLKKHRTNDVNLNIGIGVADDALDYFEMSSPTLNTFVREEALNYEANEGIKIRKVTKVPVRRLDSVLDEYNEGKFPDLMSIDIEGMELTVLNTIDFNRHAPKVICIETMSYSSSGRGEKNDQVIDLIKSKGYIVFADTYINTIFVREDHWIK